MEKREAAPKPPGRAWWIATSGLHLISAAIFVSGVWACVHWLQRVNTDSYYDTHQDADPDGMMMLEGIVLILAVGCVVALIYSIVGLALTASGIKGGPIMMLLSLLVTFLAAALSVSELYRGEGVLGSLFTIALLAFMAAGVVAPIVAMQKPQRIPPPPGRPVPPPYLGGSPYLRPPGS